jgi:hypothetical protein
MTDIQPVRDIDMNGLRIKNVGAPQEKFDAVSRDYLERRLAELEEKLRTS